MPLFDWISKSKTGFQYLNGLTFFKEFHGDWYGVEYGSDLVQKLSKKFDVSGIPYLVVLKTDGTIITKEGRSAVQGQGPSVVRTWKNSA